MSIEIIEQPAENAISLELAKASLLQTFTDKINALPPFMVMEAVLMDDDASLAFITQKRDKPPKPLSIRVRNQLAFAKLKGNAFESLHKSYDLVGSNDVCTILGITKQALSLKTRAGEVVAYTKDRRKYFPAFQFVSNKVSPDVGNIIKALGIDPTNETMMNFLILFLAQSMEFHGPSKPEIPRYKLLGDASAITIIIRDFNNRAEMGK
jgi:hypothetical protein